MEDLNFWILFFSTALILNITPGPDLLYILTKTISNGTKVGIASAIGVCTGALFHVFAAAIGLSAILVTSATAFTIVKIIGVMYLFYLAYQSFSSKGTSLNISGEKKHSSVWQAFKQGVLIDILNPKVAIFFMAFLPQFVREGHGSVSIQLIYLGLLVILVAIIVEVAYVLMISKIGNAIRNSKTISKWLDKIIGMMFVVLGLKLVLSSNK